MTPYQTMVVTWSILFLAPSSGWAQSIVAAVLPLSRSVRVGTFATVFATVINIGFGYSYELRYLFKHGHPGHF